MVLYAIAAIFILLILTGFIFFCILNRINYDICSKHKQNKAHLSCAQLESSLEIQERLLQHINYELNNNINQIASVIKMTLHTVDCSNHDKTERKLEDISEMTRQVMAGVKTLSSDIDLERILNTDLSGALTHETDRINRTGLLHVVFEQQGEPTRLAHTKTIIIYRITQMILDNATTHSNAKLVNINLRFTKNLITLALKDDGRGFDVEKTLSGNLSGGLAKAIQRAEIINAKLMINSSVGFGTQVIIEIPYE